MAWMGWILLYLMGGVITAAFARWYTFRSGIIGADIFDHIIDRWLIGLSFTVWPLLATILLCSWARNKWVKH